MCGMAQQPPGPVLDDVPWLGPYPDRFLVADEASGPEAVAVRTESVELAFVTALQRLSSPARAVLAVRSARPPACGPMSRRPAAVGAWDRAARGAAQPSPSPPATSAATATGGPPVMVWRTTQ